VTRQVNYHNMYNLNQSRAGFVSIDSVSVYCVGFDSPLEGGCARGYPSESVGAWPHDRRPR
jgi:hypothetical protein